MIEVICPKCGSVLTSHVITTYPPINKVSCPHCGWEREDKQNIIRVVMQEPPMQTNADRIRAMTDEELAEFLSGTDGDFLPTGEALTVSAGEKRWLEWLKSPVEEVDK